MSGGDENKQRPIITLHVVSSLDGLIARSDNSVSWLESPEDVYEAGAAYDSAAAEEVLKAIDCFVLGSRTYEHALELGWPYGDTPTVVLSKRELQSTRESVEFHSGSLRTLVDEVLTPRFENVWVVGGAQLCQSFLSLDLIDRMILSIAPILLGDGLRLFGADHGEQRWRLKDVVAYKTGFVELSYERATDG